MKIVFVILHYLTIDDTIECINSIIENIDYSNYSIIVVDNGSPNETGIVLKKLYQDNDYIDVILSNENLGFAKGNNIGFRYAKYQKEADFIVMINNDTIIKQETFCSNIVDNYINFKFHIAGPDIISLVDNQHQNPINKIFNNENDVLKRKLKLQLLLTLNLIGLDSIFQNIYKKIKPNKGKDFIMKSFDDIQLHGSCMIFSPEYIKKYEGLCEKTFMYLEEDILKYISDRDNLIIKYLPDLLIFHKEDSATDSYLGSNKKKRNFYYKNSINSCNILIDLMKKDKNKIR